MAFASWLPLRTLSALCWCVIFCENHVSLPHRQLKAHCIHWLPDWLQPVLYPSLNLLTSWFSSRLCHITYNGLYAIIMWTTAIQIRWHHSMNYRILKRGNRGDIFQFSIKHSHTHTQRALSS